MSFGTSGHRGSSLRTSFNDVHIAAISQAVCNQRRKNRISGPIFMGFDTHALSAPAFVTALEVLAANGVETMIAIADEYTPTPAVSHSILGYNRGSARGRADGIVITPSQNPPEDGGFKYNPPNGGPADTDVRAWIEKEANRLIAENLSGVLRIPFARARSAATTHEHDFLGSYVADLGNVIDFDAVHGATLKLGVDPLGGAESAGATFSRLDGSVWTTTRTASPRHCWQRRSRHAAAVIRASAMQSSRASSERC